MRLLKALVVAATTLTVFAHPVRHTRKDQDNNVLVLQFASVLEALETEFYKQGIQKFSDQDFQNAGFSSTAIVSDQLGTIQADEQAHLDFLVKGLNALGAPVPDGCQFNFDSVLTDVPTMAAAARTVELVGVGAYLGGASLITDPQLLTAAASILTIEARHQTILNAMSGIGTPIPQAFDVPMTPSEVLAIAGPFISGCDLGIPANKPLTVTNSDPPSIGTTLAFDFDGKDSSDNLHCQMLVGGVVNSISLPIDQCTVPEGINGPVLLFITADQQPLANNVVLRQFANNLVAGPTIAFIDSSPNPLSQLLRAGVSGASSGDSGSGDISTNDGSSSGPDFVTGSAAAGAVIVNGWTNLPNQDQSQDGSDPNASSSDPNAIISSTSDPNATLSSSDPSSTDSSSDPNSTDSSSDPNATITSSAPDATSSGSAGAAIIASS